MTTLITYGALDQLMTRWRGAAPTTGRPGARAWRVPTSDAGWLDVSARVHTALSWVTIMITREGTTDRPPSADAWFEAHVWPAVKEECERLAKRKGRLPDRSTGWAEPVPKTAVLEILERWIDAELAWSRGQDPT